ncbi:MAG: dipeptidase PepV [Bacilli bacterium]|nr:dipeptidase PepV [Bacilli bacterium]MBN2877756.1 dipeptidase PepV [Bacilli bacterium]
MNWLEIAKNYEEEFVDLTRKLLQIPTVLETFDPDNIDEPFGPEIRKALDFMLDLGEKDGFIVKNIDNYAGHIEFGEGEEVLGVLGHLDVVPAGGKWDNPPFSATIKDGKIYARGAMDDKGPTIAAYIAMKMIKDQGIGLNKKVRLILGCDEESGMRGVLRYLEKEKMPDIGFAPDAEFPLIYAEKGIYTYNFLGEQTDEWTESMTAGERYNVVPDECVVVLKKDLRTEFEAYCKANDYVGRVEGNTYTIIGQNAHAAMPFLGVNAISLMTNFLKEHSKAPFIHFIDEFLSFDHYGNKLGLSCFDKEMKELTNNLAYIHYDGLKVNIGCNIRYPRNYDFAAGEIKMTEAANQHSLEYALKKNSVPHYVSPKDPLIQILMESYQKYSGDNKSEMITIGGGTYARQLSKAVAFGALFPGEEELAHQPNEFLDIKKMLTAIAIYAESIERLAGN